MKEQPGSYGEFSATLFRESGSGRLIRAQLELTYDCNLHCRHCYTDCFNRPELIARELSTTRLIDSLDQLRELGVLWLCLTGGEVFVRKDFFTIYEAALDRGFLVTLFTNATLITDEIADRLARRPPFSIEVSIHGATDATFDAVTQVPGSARVFRACLARLLERGLPVKLKTSGMSLNRHELDDLKRLVEKYGLPFRLDTMILPSLDGGPAPSTVRLAPAERLAVERHFAADLEGQECSARGEPTRREHRAPSDDRLYRCGCGTNTVQIDPYGSVGACIWQRDPRFSLIDKPLAEGVPELFHAIRSARYEGRSECRGCEIHEFVREDGRCRRDRDR